MVDEKVDKMTMPAGLYYIGDLCYVMHDEWSEVCSLLIAGRDDGSCNEGEFVLADGRRFAIYNTAYGDGSYLDTDGNSYGVDSGSIGCIRIEDIRLTDKNTIGLGVALTFISPFETSGEGAVIRFGDVEIDTDPPYEDDYDDDVDEAQEWHDFDPDC
jgi:hypothetical protein